MGRQHSIRSSVATAFWVAGSALALAATAAAAPGGTGSPAVNINQLKARAQAGDAVAEYDLGSKYQFGHDGLPKAPAAAFCWTHRSAEHGYIMAWLGAGMMYYMGTGVAKDDVESYKWFYLAQWLTPSDWPAEVRRDADEDEATVAKHLSAANVEEGKRRAEAWWAAVGARGKLKPGEQYVPFPGDKPPCPTPG